jgi:transposase-like protein
VATKGTLFYRLRTDPQIVLCVITLLVYGCPLQAIVKTFGFDERTVKSWWLRAGVHCRAGPCMSTQWVRANWSCSKCKRTRSK